MDGKFWVDMPFFFVCIKYDFDLIVLLAGFTVYDWCTYIFLFQLSVVLEFFVSP